MKLKIYHKFVLLPLCLRTSYAFNPISLSILKRAPSFLLSQASDEIHVLKTYDDYQEQMEALSFLSTVASDTTDLVGEAQEIFDDMFQKWYDDDREDLEPTTAIYNSLISVYGHSGDAKTASSIFRKMVDGVEGIPEADEQTYIAMLEIYEKNRNMKKAKEILALYQEKHDDISVEIYNMMLTLYKRSGDWNSPQEAEELLKSMPSPNTKSFCLVMQCYNRNSHKSKVLLASEKINELADTMTNLGRDDVNVNDRSIMNERIKSIASRRDKTAFEDAEKLLMEMTERSDGNEKPSASTFINTINVLRGDRSASATKKSLTLLKVLKDMYKKELESEGNWEKLKPDTRVVNAVMNVVARTKAKGKAQLTKDLLSDLVTAHIETHDDDFSPNLRTYNNVITACAFTRGDEVECKESLKIMVETFNEMKMPESSHHQPNEVTFGLFLKGLSNLVNDEGKRQNIAENLFRKCCRDGYVNQFVLDSLVEATNADFVEQILGRGDEDGVSIPEEWCRQL